MVGYHVAITMTVMIGNESLQVTGVSLKGQNSLDNTVNGFRQEVMDYENSNLRGNEEIKLNQIRTTDDLEQKDGNLEMIVDAQIDSLSDDHIVHAEDKAVKLLAQSKSQSEVDFLGVQLRSSEHLWRTYFDEIFFGMILICCCFCLQEIACFNYRGKRRK